jgi:hypothetical protein
MRAKESGEADASGWALRVRRPQEEGPYHHPLTGRTHSSCPRPGEAQLYSRGSRSAVGLGHNVREDLGGLALPRLRPRYLFPEGRRLVDGEPSQDGACAGRGER